MNTSIVKALRAAVCITALLSQPIQASSFNGDSKHGSARPAAARDDSQYAKYVWVGSEDNRPIASVNHIIVSIPDQRLYAYHGQQLVAWSNVSSGRPGHDTPTGDFTVSEKDADHHSSIYDNASMPFFMRLTDGGVGLHAGLLPGYPASHGCVRLPLGMARDLYQQVDPGTPVEIINTSVDTSVARNLTLPVASRLAQD